MDYTILDRFPFVFLVPVSFGIEGVLHTHTKGRGVMTGAEIAHVRTSLLPYFATRLVVYDLVSILCPS